MKVNKSQLAICIMVPVLVGLIAGLLTRSGMEVFGGLNKPALSPPAWLFPIVWLVLYVLMGVSSYLVIRHGRDREDVQKALSSYLTQLFLNFLWPILFFNFQWYLAAFVCLVLMWFFILKTILQFAKIDRLAAILMIPYLLWTTFAGYLNLAIYFLN